MKRCTKSMFHLQLGCISAGVDYPGGNLMMVNGLETKEMCQKLCQDTSECLYFTWVGDEYFSSSNHKECFLKDRTMEGENNVVGLYSGPKFCSRNDYNDSLFLSYLYKTYLELPS